MRSSLSEKKCLLCAARLVGPILNLGDLPSCNRLTNPPARVETHPLAIAGCPACGLVQLAQYPPAQFVVPRVRWINYREPDQHLDEVVDQIVGAISKDRRRAIGLGSFETPLLDRLALRGFEVGKADLLARPRAESSPGRFPYLETLQARLTPGILEDLTRAHGAAGLVSLRYVLEHCHDPLTALAAMKPLVTSGGLLLIEVPDCSKFLALLDYGFIWEEHITHLTHDTLCSLARRAGYEVNALLSYQGPLEDALVALLRPASYDTYAIPPGGNDAFARYQTEFVRVRAAYQSRLAEMTAAGEKIAVFGAGHQAIMFVNALGLTPYIAMMVDDDPIKQGHAPPGASTPIVSSTAMLENPAVTGCLLAVGPRAEPIVTQKCAPLLARGGLICSIFPGGKTPTVLEYRQ